MFSPYKKTRAKARADDHFSGTLAHLYSGAIDLKFPLPGFHMPSNPESQVNFALAALCLDCSHTFATYLLDMKVF